MTNAPAPPHLAYVDISTLMPCPTRDGIDKDNGILPRLLERLRATVGYTAWAPNDSSNLQFNTYFTSDEALNENPFNIPIPETSPQQTAPTPIVMQDNEPSPTGNELIRTSSDDSDAHSTMTTFSVSNTKSLNRLITRLRGAAVDKEYWMSDKHCKECFECSAQFKFFRRKHHCRLCGRIFCGKCASHIIQGERVHRDGEVRVCNGCFAKLEWQEQEKKRALIAAESPYLQRPMDGIQIETLIVPSTSTGVLDASGNSEREERTRQRAVSSTGPRRPSSVFIGHLLRFHSTIDESPLVPDTPLAVLETRPLPSPLQTKGTPRANAKTPSDTGGGALLLIDGSDDDHHEYEPDHVHEHDIHSSADVVLTLPKGKERDVTSRLGDVIDDTKQLLHTNSDVLMSTLRRRRISVADLVHGPRRPRALSIMRSIMNLSDEDVRTPTSGRKTLMAHDTKRSSSPRSKPMAPTSLDPMSLQHVRLMIQRLLDDENMPDRGPWESILMRLLQKVSANVHPDVRNGDEIDVRHYVKIKKVPGGLPDDSVYINGIVCSKQVAHKSMVRTIKQPHILILLFPLEWSRDAGEGDLYQHQFESIDSVMAQEQDYLEKLVQRIVSLKPDIVLVSDNVSRMALHYLVKANIIVSYHVKLSVLDAVARCTGASIVSSLVQLNKDGLALGRCGVFECRTLLHEWIPNRRKSFLMFYDCPPQLGATILLRGGQMETLRSAKRILNLMIFVVHHLKLESGLLADASQTYSLPSPLLPPKETPQTPSNDPCLALTGQIIKTYQRAGPSASPRVAFSEPYLLARLRETQAQLVSMCTGTLPSAPRTLSDCPAYVRALPIKAFDETAYHLLLDEHHRRWQAAEACFGDGSKPPSPWQFQQFLVLYTSTCQDAQVPCQGPEIRLFEYYQLDSDLTLGQYIEDLVAEMGVSCMAQTCDADMSQHSRIYAHDSGYVKVSIQGDEHTLYPKIQQWRVCRVCGVESARKDMSDLAWQYSFGKFLEFFFHQQQDIELSSCHHGFYRNYSHYFGFLNAKVRLDYNVLHPYEVYTPSMYLCIDKKECTTAKEKALTTLRSKITRFYDSIIERNKRLVWHRDPMPSPMTKDRLDDLSRCAMTEKKQMLQSLQFIYANTDPTDILTLNAILVRLQIRCMHWETEYTWLNLTPRHEPRFRRRLANTMRVVSTIAAFKEQIAAPITSEPIALLDSICIPSEQDESAQAMDTSNESNPEELPVLGESPTSSHASSIRREERSGTVRTTKPKASSLLDSSVARRFSLIWMKENKKNTLPESDPNDTPTKATRQPSSQPVHPTSNMSDQTSAKSLISIESPRPSTGVPATKKNELPPLTINTSPELALTGFRYGLARSTERRRSSIHRLRSFLPSPSTQRNVSFDNPTRRKTELSSPLTPRARSKLPIHRHPSKSSLEVFTTIRELVRGASDDEFQNSDEDIDEEDNRGYGVHGFFSHTIVDDDDFYGLHHPSVSLRNAHPVRDALPCVCLDEEHDDIDMHGLHVSTERSQSDDGLSMESGTDSRPIPTSLSASALLDLSGNGQEKNRFVRALTSMTSMLTDVDPLPPLELPLSPEDHYFPDSLVIVKENEPSTIVAYALCGDDYRDKLNDPHAEFSEGHDDNDIHTTPDTQESDASAVAVEQTLCSKSGIHMKYHFADSSTKFFCRIYFAQQFDALRQNCGCQHSYITSLSSCHTWDSSGGKSGSMFLKTNDDRFIIKEISKYEMSAFLRFAPSYFQYMSEAFFHDLPTVLCKIVGLYRIGFQNSTTGKSMSMDILVMENLFYGRNLQTIYDLKGSMRNRLVPVTGKKNEVLLDENMVQAMYRSPLLLRFHAKELLRSALHNDTLFLSRLNVMDYSLLVGIDEKSHELVVGIVDFIRTFTLDKKLESWVKESGILGGGGKEPTVISPRQYCLRFREAMDRYFIPVPDTWSAQLMARSR